MSQESSGTPIDGATLSPHPDVHDLPTDTSERLQLALDAGAIVGTWVWDVFNDRVTADERFSRSFGLSAERCRMGIPISEAFGSIHPDDLLRVDGDIKKAMACGGSFRCEYRVRQYDGCYRWVEASGRAEHDIRGEAIRFPGVLMDIEGRRAAEAERDKMSALLRTFTAAVPGVVYAKDRQGRMLVANQGTTELIGKPPEFYLGKTDAEFLEDKEQARLVMETDQRIMRSGKAEQVEERVNMADGSAVVWLSAKAPLFNESGEVVGLIGSSIDVTARKNAELALLELNRTLQKRIDEAIAERETVEATLRQSQKMEAVGQLSGGIAHDFNNLLAGITGSLDMIKLRLSQGRIADVERYAAVASGAIERAATLTHRLLAFSRRQTLVPSCTDVNRLIGGMEELIQRTVGPAIRLKVDLKAELSTCLVDGAQVENSLLNLCINARDALKEGGTIHVSTSNEVLNRGPDLDGELQPGTYLTICVADEGSGMSEETLSRAFEPFFTTKPIGAGTGLGLSMVYGFAKQSGGHVKIRSAIGMGTTVCLHLPHYSAPVDATDEEVTPPVPESTLRDMTVLVVDDEPTVRMFVSEMLAGIGYKVIEAFDGVSGLQILESNSPIDLLITDIGLPGGVDGREMVAKGRNSRPALPVLFITGYAEPSIFSDPISEPHTHLITKPFSLEKLISCVNSLIQTHSRR